MGFIKKENKKFNYTPRYYKGEGNPYEFKHTFDEYRTTVGKNRSLKAKFDLAFSEFKDSNFKFNKTILLIAAVLVFVFLYIIDFELSIFLK